MEIDASQCMVHLLFSFINEFINEAEMMRMLKRCSPSKDVFDDSLVSF